MKKKRHLSLVLKINLLFFIRNDKSFALLSWRLQITLIYRDESQEHFRLRNYELAIRVDECYFETTYRSCCN